MNHQAPVPTLQQQNDLKRLLAQDRAERNARKYRDAQLDAIYHVERSAGLHRAINLAAFPSMQPMPQRRPTVWQQIKAELIAAPLGQKIGIACFFGFGVGVTVALFCGWL